jgi:hypothetical protein
MGASEGKPGRSPRKEPYTITYCHCDHGIADVAAHATCAASETTTSALPGRSILQRPWRATRPCRRWGEYDAVGAGCLEACVEHLSRVPRIETCCCEMDANDGKPCRSPRKEPNTIDCGHCDHGIFISLLMPPAQPLDQQHRRCRGAASCRGPGTQRDLADAGVSMMLSWLGVWRAHKLVRSTWQLSRVVNGDRVPLMRDGRQ